MQFEFKGLSSVEERTMPNFMNEADNHAVVRDFDNMDAAINYVADHKGFITTNDGKFSFVVKNITALTK